MSLRVGAELCAPCGSKPVLLRVQEPDLKVMLRKHSPETDFLISLIPKKQLVWEKSPPMCSSEGTQ